MVSLTGRPRRPPWALTSLAQSSYPFWNAWPSAAKFPVRDSDAPMVRGPVELLGEMVLPMPPPMPLLSLLLLPLQAARTPAESTARALTAIAFLENQGRSGRTPGFLLPPGNRRKRPHDH